MRLNNCFSAFQLSETTTRKQPFDSKAVRGLSYTLSFVNKIAGCILFNFLKSTQFILTGDKITLKSRDTSDSNSHAGFNAASLAECVAGIFSCIWELDGVDDQSTVFLHVEPAVDLVRKHKRLPQHITTSEICTSLHGLCSPIYLTICWKLTFYTLPRIRGIGIRPNHLLLKIISKVSANRA